MQHSSRLSSLFASRRMLSRIADRFAGSLNWPLLLLLTLPLFHLLMASNSRSRSALHRYGPLFSRSRDLATDRCVRAPAPSPTTAVFAQPRPRHRPLFSCARALANDHCFRAPALPPPTAVFAHPRPRRRPLFMFMRNIKHNKQQQQ